MLTTLTTSLVVFAALAGLGGLAFGAFALVRTRAVLRDCRDLVHRLLPDGSGLDARAVRDVAVVRYDALEEMSGARSFSLAMLNASGDGVVMTSINGRTESRTYAKTIEQGRAAEALSPEEYRAIRSARLGKSPASIAADEAATAPAPAPAPRSGSAGSATRLGSEAAPAPGRKKRSKSASVRNEREAANVSGADGAEPEADKTPPANRGDGADSDTSTVRTLGAASSGQPGASD